MTDAQRQPIGTSRICRAIAAVTFLLGGTPAHAGTFGLDTGFPGPSPGPARLHVQGQDMTAGTGAISLSWSMTQGLKPREVRDEQLGQSTPLSGDVFQIVLSGGQRYGSSSLVMEGSPRVGEHAAQPAAARLAARIPGRRVELQLRSRDDRLRVAWRALVHDGANYVRQEIDVTALSENGAIKEVLWLDGSLPAARTAGRVDGSPVVAGSLFLGCEDPHALNLVTAPSRSIGAWSPDDLQPDKPRNKTWPVDAAMLRSGTNEFVFQYERGPHRLDIWRASLLEDGRVVSRDEHHGWTGTEHVDNEYSLTLPSVKPGSRYELAADIGTDPAFKLPPGQRLDSSGKVLLRVSAGRVSCKLRRDAPLRKGQSITQSFVIGVAPPGQMRRAFLYYLQRERAHPYRPYLHYNSWYDTAWDPFALNEANCLEAIRACGENLVKRHGVVLDGMVFDDGWDDPKTLWQFHAGFPKGFAPLAELCKQYNTRLGVWLSPFGGYGEPKNQRLKFGRQQGYEVNATGFSMAGPMYYAAFKRACVEMIRKYGVNHFKFDGIASGMYASGAGADYMLDTEGVRRLTLELRQEDPNLYINLTTGSWPSPFWLRYADSLWRQGGDMGLAGKGSKQQQWLTYRDQETYRNIVRKGPLYPLNSLMTQGVAYSRRGSAGEPTFNSAGFKDDVRAFFGSGTSLQELYIQPGRLTAEDWSVLAEAAKWSRANAAVLVDTHWIGGDPSKLEPYGFASWSPSKGVVMLRNPDQRPQEFALELQRAFELPAGAPTKYVLRSPWAEDRLKPVVSAEAGKPVRLLLKPFEVIVFDAVPAE